MKKYILPVLLIYSFISCKDEMNEKASLSKQEMVPVIYQMMLVDELSSQYKLTDSTLRSDSLRSKKYDEVFAYNEVTYEEFKSSYEFYLARPDQLKIIFDSVEALGNRIRLEQMNPSLSTPETSPKGKAIKKKPE